MNRNIDSKEILVIGSTVADVIINVDVLPTTEQDIHVKSQTVSLGGCAYNVYSMIRNLDVPCTLFSPVGTGIYGDFVRRELTARGIASPVPSPDKDNGCCYCFVEESGERTFVCYHGAEYLFKREWFEALDTERFSCAYICGLEIEDKTGSVIVDFLEQSGILPVFAPGPRIDKIDPALMKRIFALHPIVHLNRDEVQRFTCCDTIQDAAKALYALTDNTVVITSGADGAYCCDGGTLIHVPGVKPERVVDTIGAGDGHCGAVMACLALGMDMTYALKIANKAASMVVSVKGALLGNEEKELLKKLLP